jgi:acetyl-CoA C-acetyltransferase
MAAQAPVLVGIARLTQRITEPGGGLDAVDLMCEAVLAALADASAPGLARRAGLIAVPRGMWPCANPAGVVAERIGAPAARTISAEVGVLQQSLITGACEAIASGDVDVAIVCGGEARYRHVLASRAGVDAPEHPGPESPPDDVWRPSSPVVSAYEFERGVVMAPIQYAMIGSAFAHASGWTPDEHRARLGALWSSYAAVAADDPLAWDRSSPRASEIVTPSDANRMVAFPYTRLLCSQWNVDQAAALVFASADAARECGVPTDRCVFPVAAAESNAMIPMYQRVDVHRWPALALAGARALELAGRAIEDAGPLEIYSCFPSAVLAQCAELGVPDGRTLSVTGGMTFGGGPLNNFVIQSTVAMAERLRGGADTTGIVTSVSGLLTKPGVAVWSSSPSSDGFRSADVSDEALAATPTRPMSEREQGPGTVVAATVVHDRGRPPRAAAVVELADGSRTVGSSQDDDVIEMVTTTDPVGCPIAIAEPGRLSLSS